MNNEKTLKEVSATTSLSCAALAQICYKNGIRLYWAGGTKIEDMYLFQNGLTALSEHIQEPVATSEDVTPAMAEEFLHRPTRNRAIKAEDVNRYVDIIKRKEWKTNGEGISIGTDGSLLDGQHRLSAIVKANMPVHMTISWNCDTTAMATIDIGRKRSLSDIQKIYSIAGAKNILSVVKQVMIERRGYSSEISVNIAKLTYSEIVEEYFSERQSVYDDIARCANTLTEGIRLIPCVALGGIIGYIWFTYPREYIGISREFFDELFDKKPCTKEFIRRTRNRILKDGLSRRAQRMSKQSKRNLIVHTWNAYLQGKNISHISSPLSGVADFYIPKTIII